MGLTGVNQRNFKVTSGFLLEVFHINANHADRRVLFVAIVIVDADGIRIL